MGTLYDVKTHTINYHLKKIFEDKELSEYSVIRKFRITAADSKSYQTAHYNLSARDDRFESSPALQSPSGSSRVLSCSLK